MHDNGFDRLPKSWQYEVRRLRRTCQTYRQQLRAAEQRIAELVVQTDGDDEFSKLHWLKRTDGHKFTGAELRALLSIFNHSGADGRKSHPGLKLMTEETGYGKAAVSGAVSSLKGTRMDQRDLPRQRSLGQCVCVRSRPGCPDPPE